MSYQLRPATADDADAVFETKCAAFEVDRGSPRGEQSRSFCRDRIEEHLVLLDEAEEIVGVVHIGDHALQVGRSSVRKADVGHVAVRPELQGRGVGTMMMREALIWLTDQGYHLSRLGGRASFYARFGYEPFPRRFVEIRLRPIKVGGSPRPASEAYADSGEWPGRVRPYDPSRDFEDRARLRAEFDGGRSGALPPPERAEPPRHPAPPDPGALHWVYERAGEVLGCLHAVEAPQESADGEATFSIAEFAYARDFPDAAGALVRTLLSRICEHEPVRVTSRLPFDEELAEALQRAEVPFDRVERYEAVATNMILVLSLARTLEAIAPELERRLADSLVADWSGAIELRFPRRGMCRADDPTQTTAGDALPGEACRLIIRNGRVGVDSGPGPEDLQIELTQAQFVKALFGISGLAELPCAREIVVFPVLRGLLDALFPRTQTGSGPWG